MSDEPRSHIAQRADQRASHGLLPRGLLIVGGLAAGVIVFAGMRSVAGIIGPIFLALALTITVYPLRSWILGKGAPRWLATSIVVVGVYAVLVGLALALLLSVTRFAALLPQYVPQMQANVDKIHDWLTSIGIKDSQIQEMLKKISPSSVIDLVQSVLGSALGVVSTLVFVIAIVLFLGLDVTKFSNRIESARLTRSRALDALTSYALGTRMYFIVSTIFGGIVAVLDGIALVIINVPAAGLWALLAFVTNYIPNIGFVIGLIPPALLALLTAGVGQMIAVIAVYTVLNVLIQSVLQPKFVGDAVGLTTTVSFLSLIVWAFVLGPLGAILAVPMTLLAKAILVDSDPDARWLQLFLGDQPDHTTRREKKARAAAQAPPDPDAVPPAAADSGATA